MKTAALVALSLGAHPGLAARWSVPCSPERPVVFVGVTLLTMTSPDLIQGSTVVVRGGLIEAINPVTPPPDACRIEARGKVLMPGLSDLHVHTDEREMPLFLANGITMVREMNGTPTHLRLRDRIARGEVAGPRMLVASPLMAGTRLPYRHTLINTPEEADQAAHQAKDAGYDYLKIYDGLSRASYDAFVEAAATLHLPLDGHIPADVGLERVLEAGQSLQHLDKIAVALGGHAGDTSGFAKARALLTGRRVWFTPTLASIRALDAARTTEYAAQLEKPEMAWVDSASLEWWRSLSGTRTRTGPSAFYRLELAALAMLRDAGARFLLGTDAANPLMVAGFSAHHELAVLVEEGGFTRYQALLSATRNVGEFLGDSLRGRLVVGAPADLILVEGDPLGNLDVLRSPIGVMVSGRWFDRPQLDSMLATARPR